MLPRTVYSRLPFFLFIITSALLTVGRALTGVSAGPAGGPVLKWQRGGCFSSWCETGWYASPAVADLDGDGNPEVIWASYSVVALDGVDGSLEWRADPPGGRAWPGVVVADLEGNGDLEIVTAHGDGYFHVFDHLGNVVLSRQPTPGNELRSLAVYDLEEDGDLEIIVASTRSEDQWWVYEHNGSVRAGEWPQHGPDSNTNGYSAGAYNENVAAGDLDGDGLAEIIGPSDVHYITAYQDDGAQMLANVIYGTNPNGTNKVWSRVGVHIDHSVDLIGYANCGVEHRPNFANTAPIIVDVNGDGVLEIIVVGNVYNCGTNPYTSLYEMPFIFNADRTRWSGSGYNWTAIPAPDGAAGPLSEDYDVIESALPNPVAADLDGDGLLEILYASYDGRVHAYWLDKSEHGSWPYSVYNPAEGFFRFASEPAVADLDDDGLAEVIFASWPEKGNNRVGRLHVLDYQGQVLATVNLPAPFSDDWNGGLGGPTLANVDGDADLEIVLGTAHSGVVVYDLPGTANARVLWATGRGNSQRSGSLIQGTVQGSVKRVNYPAAEPGDSRTFTILLRNPGPLLPGVLVTDTLPTGLNFQGGLTASSGTVAYSAGTVTWNGDVDAAVPVTITFEVMVDSQITTPQVIVNTALIDDGLGNVWARQAAVVVNGYQAYLPILRR
ncbi:MAG: FG-GAP-like repeat-containing protein [Chloroflexi bacterium]|nr:FG-GAP-like repeat-containing protein [Chloroflexota bacterium]MCI0577692.1 FG-GAP-like repeat-containing protein [Chloroflexota bacterium]MCI0644588.1 FG-GAP-like repeat-containing protein [Chloroflexota bacterium]MCI0728238.1 FG-GAP-like repeat-containing protein [Chloroflexota bacterium]